jgi:hypothetical protein
MIPPRSGRYARRDFLRTSTLAMTGLGLAVRPARAEPPPTRCWGATSLV